jgi:multidrug efflux system outer membrane protein
MRASKLAWLCAAASTAGCSLAPDYAPPRIETAAAYKEIGPWQPAASAPLPAGSWWQAFGDPTLDALEARIEAANPDLAAAVARYDQAAGLLRQARAAQLPEVSVGVDASRNRVSGDRPLADDSATYGNVSVGASLAYELDLFGRVRNSVRANAANAEASAADVAAVRLGIQASLATNYFRMRGLDARIDLLRETVAAFQRAFDLTDTRHSGGVASGIDVSRSRAQLSTAKVEFAAVTGERATYEHAIAILVGQSPSTFAIPVAGGQTRPPAVPVGLPSTLLERRPDVAAAERRVAAANARIGVARAALFPSVTLGASGGFEASAGNLLSASSGFWALGPLSAALSIFDGGARRAGVRIARAEYDEIAANYRGTVLAAFREVEDNLVLSRSLIDQERDQGDAVAAAERTRDLALIRYRDGASDYLEVVIAQTAALDAERALLEIRTRRLEVSTDTIRAIGGSF